MSENQTNTSNNTASQESSNEKEINVGDGAIGINGGDAAGVSAPVPTATSVVLNVPVTIQPTPIPVEKEPAAVAVERAVNEMRGGSVVTTRSAVSVEQTHEFKAAMEVAKMATQSALHQVVAYCDAMKPGKPQTEKTVAASQMGLLGNLFIILSGEDKNFPVVYRALLSIVNANKSGAFRVESRNRGLNSISLEMMDNKQMRFLTRIVDLMCVNAGINDLELVKQHVNITRVLESVYNARIKQNLTAFYSV